MVFMELKLHRNISMSYYWHQFPGLIHFSFINRQDNLCVIPTIDMCSNFDMDEKKINLAYKKYLPMVATLFYKYNCTQLQFVDDKLKLVFSYFVWFEDIKSNYIPVDLNLITQVYNKFSSSTAGDLFYWANLALDQKNYKSPGITNKSYYDLLPRLCYPNAPDRSLICYELYSIHSPTLNDAKIKRQLNKLMFSLSKKAKS